MAHEAATLGEAWAVMERHGITEHPPLVYDNSFAVANALLRLEAQRADLLAACEAVLHEGAYDHGGRVRIDADMLQAIRAAVAKARGE